MKIRFTCNRIALVFALVGCSGSSMMSSSDAAPQPDAGPSPSQQHLYISKLAAFGGHASVVSVYALPLASSSTPVLNLQTPGNNPLSPCFDGAGHILVPDCTGLPVCTGRIFAYALPLTGSSTPAFTLATPYLPWDCHFDSSGNMYVAQNEITTSVGANQVSVFKAPVQTGSTMSSMISTPTATSGVWTDSSGRVYVEGRTAIAIYSALNEGNALQATFPNGANGSSSTPVCCNIALGPTGSLYVPTQAGPGRIYVFDPPFTNTSAPDIAETIQLPDDPSTPYLFDAAFDAAGNLYVGSGLVFFEGATAVSHVYMLKPPYLAVSADVVLYGDQIQGVAIGP